MSSFTFFPPPSRSLSRVDSKPGSDKSGGSSSSRNKRNGLQPLSMSSNNNNNNNSRTRVQANAPSSSNSSRNASGTTTPEGQEHDGHAPTAHKSTRPVTSPGLTSPGGLRSPLLTSSDSFQGYSSDTDPARSQVQTGKQSGTNSPRRPSGLDSPRLLRDRSSSYTSGGGSMSSTSTTQSASSPAKRGTTSQSSGGRLGHRLPQGMYFDLVRSGEVGQVHKLERESFSIDDTATLDTLRNRQRDAPHLFLGAYLPLPPPKVSGPLSMSGPAPRKLIAYACGTAASAYTARAIKIHSDDEHAWLVCLHSVCVAPEYRHKGVALRMMEEYVRRLRRAEAGAATKKNYECVAVLSHEDMMPLYEKAGFKKLGFSHVNIGSGGWLEMRRWIVPKDEDGEEQPESSTGSPSEKSLSSSVVVAAETTEAPLSSEDGHEAATTPTQELERRLHAHVATLSGDTTATNPSDKNKEEAPLPAPILTTTNLGASGQVSTATGGGVKMSTSPVALSPTLSDEATGAAAQLTKSPNASVSSESSAPFTTAKIMDALRKQVGTGSHPGSGAQSPRNPGMAYSTIMGQTLAAKTSVEDAFYALEARLVNREDQSTLADLYCPREECACLLVKAGNADWEFAEMGPLSQAGLSLPNSPAPPSTPLPPPPTSLDRVRSALGAQRAPAAATSVLAFWIVHSPMLFENVGFSRDAEWRMPPLPSMSASSGGGGSEGGNGSETGNGSDASAGGERKKPTKRGSLLRNASGWLANRNEARKRSNTLHMIDSQGNSAAATAGRNVRSPSMSLSPPSFDIGSGGSSATSSSNDSAAAASVNGGVVSNSAAGGLVKVKYLLCADCDCGPLGYTVLPRSLEGGNFAKEVGKQVNGSGEAAAGDEGTSTPAPDTPLYFVAADRVRYRLPK